MRDPSRDRLPVGTVTFLFTDIEGSTALVTLAGRAYDDLLARHDRILRAAIADHDGVVVNTEGDAFFAVFALAGDALAASVDAQRALDAEGWPDGRRIRVRMGIHTGEGRPGGADYVGIDVHVAARIAAAGHGGQVLISDATRGLVRSDLPPNVRLRSLGTHRLKDIAEPATLHQLDIDGLASEFPALRTLDARPTNLPPRLTSFIGREDELDALAGLVGEARLVTLTGPGGSGKTRLALQLGDRLLADHADGVFFADLARIDRPDRIVSAIVDAMDLDVDPRADAVELVKVHLRDRALLLVLDNMEHVIDGAPFVAELLAASPGLRVLATSRMPLRIGGEREFAVGPIALPGPGATRAEIEASDAVALFVDRARAIRADLELDEASLSVVVDIVTRLEGIPLAIELAAGRVRILDLATIASQLERQLPVLTGSQRDRPERQRTMRGAIDWSYRLLDDDDRRLFVRLAAFPGGCTIDAARAVSDDDALGRPLIEVLGSLVEQSLVRMQASEDGPRFGMLVAIAEYATERLAEDPAADETRRRAARHWMAMAEEAEPHLVGEDQRRWLDRAEREEVNVRAALRWAIDAGEAELAQRTVSARWRYWQQRGPVADALALLDEVVALEGADPVVRARAFGAAGALAWWSGGHVAARTHLERGYRFARESGDERVLMRAARDLGFVTLWPTSRLQPAAAPTAPMKGPPVADPEDAAAAEALVRESLAIAERLGDELAIGQATRALGQVLGVARGDVAGSIELIAAALERFERIGARYETAETHVTLANGLRFGPRPERARAHYLAGIDLLRQAGNPLAAGVLNLLAGLESQLGRHELAARLFGAAQAEIEVTGFAGPPGGALLLADPAGAAVQAIGQEAADEAVAEGRAMSLDAAVAYVRTASDPAASGGSVSPPGSSPVATGSPAVDQSLKEPP